jgi:hypothetical protein
VVSIVCAGATVTGYRQKLPQLPVVCRVSREVLYVSRFYSDTEACSVEP